MDETMESEPAVRMGRGGAGNVHSHAAILETTKKVLEENGGTLPSNVSISASSILGSNSAHRAGSIAQSTMTHATSDRARSGRGGAGNVYKPKDAMPALKSPLPSLHTEKGACTQPSMGMGGRGGAGNYSQNKKELQILEEEEMKEAAQLRKEREEEVRKDVDMMLQPPQRAYLGGVNRAVL